MDKKQAVRTFENKVPVIFAVVCCIAVAALSAAVRLSGAPADIPVSASASGNAAKTVILDAGHGGIDSGCVAVNGAYEKDINLAIVKDLGSLLTMNGYNVIYTRTEDISVHDEGVEGIREQKISDMKNRLAVVNSCPDSIFLSVHQNLFTQSAYFGAQMFYTTNNEANMKLADIMQRHFAQLQPGNDREIKLIDNGLFLFKDTKQPALLIECGFLSNPSDAAALSSPEYQKKVAFTIYSGLTEFLSGEEKT